METGMERRSTQDLDRLPRWIQESLAAFQRFNDKKRKDSAQRQNLCVDSLHQSVGNFFSSAKKQRTR